MALIARVDINFVRVNVILSHFDLILLQFFFRLISLNIKVQLILYTKFQSNTNTPSHSEENADFIGFAMFSISSQLEFSTGLNFTIPKPWSLIMLM